MTLILDAGPLVALADRGDRLQRRVEALLVDEPGDLVVPAPVSAEVDQLLGRRLGRAARLAFMEDVEQGRFRVEPLVPEEYAVVRRLEERYPELDLGLSDLSIVVLAARFETRRVATFDPHFEVVPALDGGPFELVLG